jgi:RND family efflux transporter MFP subunit
MTGCGERPTGEKEAKVIAVKVMDVGISEGSHGLNYVGTVEEAEGVSLGFSGMGTVERVLAAEGERVGKGQLLAVLDGSTARNGYEVAKSTLHQARDAYGRLKLLHDRGSVTDIKWIEVETGLEKAVAMEAIAKKSVEDCYLYASMDGVVAKRSVEVGGNVMPGMTAFKVISIDNVDVKIAVSENEIGGVFLRQGAVVEVAALDGERFAGKVETKGVSAHPLTHTYDVKIRVGNPRERLMPGMVCKVFLEREGRTEEIVVPNRAVQISHDGRHFVWVVEGTVAMRRFVTVGALSGYGVTVNEGLSGGERLIVEGYQKVSEGMNVNVLY